MVLRINSLRKIMSSKKVVEVKEWILLIKEEVENMGEEVNRDILLRNDEKRRLNYFVEDMKKNIVGIENVVEKEKVLKKLKENINGNLNALEVILELLKK